MPPFGGRLIFVLSLADRRALVITPLCISAGGEAVAHKAVGFGVTVVAELSRLVVRDRKDVITVKPRTDPHHTANLATTGMSGLRIGAHVRGGRERGHIRVVEVHGAGPEAAPGRLHCCVRIADWFCY